METRALKLTDLDCLLALYTHLHAEDAPLPERDLVEDTWHEIQDSPHFMCFGTVIDQRLVSACTLSVIPNLTRGCRPYGLIENVVTHSAFRRRGYARCTLKCALAQAWRAGCYKVMLMTGRKDEGICRFYASVGFDGQAKQAFLARPEGAALTHVENGQPHAVPDTEGSQRTTE